MQPFEIGPRIFLPAASAPCKERSRKSGSSRRHFTPSFASHSALLTFENFIMLLPKWFASRAALIFHSHTTPPHSCASGRSSLPSSLSGREAPFRFFSDSFSSWLDTGGYSFRAKRNPLLLRLLDGSLE
jgi:hypothetical protein